MRNLLIAVSLILLTAEAEARTAAWEDSLARTAIQKAVELTFLLQYEQALKTTDELELRLPGHPIVPLLRVGVLYCRMLDYEDLEDMPEFEKYYEKAWEGADELLNSGVAEGDLYLGILLGFRALLHQRQGQWWPAVRLGMKSVGHLEDCLKQDPTFWDAYLGVGTYKYWRSRATDFLNWLPFIPDEKQTGIQMVRQAMQKGLFGREISRSTLAWILIDASRPSEAITLSLEGLKSYPGSRFYLWTLADGYQHSKQWRKATIIYQQLYDSIHLLPRNNHYNELGICKQMAQCYQNLGEPGKALEWVERGLSLPLDKQVKERRQKDLDKMKILKTDLQKELANRSSTP